MRLSDLLKNFLPPLDPDILNLELTDLKLDSRAVQKGDLYIACQLQTQQPFSLEVLQKYSLDALKNGAVAIVHDDGYRLSLPIPTIPIANLREKLSAIAGEFYHYPSYQLPIIGVTGTNGKTSSCHFIACLLQLSKQRCGLLGTAGNGFLDQLSMSQLTTPDPIATQSWLAKFVQNGAKVVAMEVSSHGLEQGRVQAVRFHTAAFTNLTQDHLDYHKTMEAYAAAKRLLFTYPNLQNAVINYDDPYGRKLIQEFAQKIPTYAYSVEEKPDQGLPIYLSDLILTNQGMKAIIHTPFGDGDFVTPLFGRHNASNLLLAVSSLLTLGMKLEEVLACLPYTAQVPGRMELFGGEGNNPLIVVDYAHTPDALHKVLLALREHCTGQLWCVFGCGGDRDRGKRPLMGSIATQYADKAIVTDDNPRHETSKQIIDDILAGKLIKEKIIIEPNRKTAIKNAVLQAAANDIVLIAGKGHETYQQIGDEKYPFDDRIEVQHALQLRTR